MEESARSRGRSTRSLTHAHAPAMEGKPVRHSITSQLYSLLASSITHGGKARDSCFCLIDQPPACDDSNGHPRRCRRRYHHRSLTASAPASVCRCSACTRADSCRQHMCPRLLQCLHPPLPHTLRPPVTWQQQQSAREHAREVLQTGALRCSPAVPSSSSLSAPAKLVCKQL